MSRVLFLANHDVGLYNFRKELIERLLSDGHQVVISSPYGERIKDLKKLGCEYYETEISRHGMNPVKDLKLIFEYKKMLKKVKPDIVFSYTIKPNIYGSIACNYKKIPCVANITGLGTAVENEGLVQKIIILLYKLAFAKVQRVYFQNTSNMQFFVDHKIALKKHDLIPGSGVNLDKFSPLDYPKGDTVEFAFISRIMKEKGIDQYLDAAEYIRKKYPNTVFHVCGFCEDAEYVEKLRQMTSSGVIQYHGMLNDVKNILKRVHCIVHPTYYPEGISNVLLESSACARPIITTNRPGCREAIDDHMNGFVVKQKDSRDLIEKIEMFIALSWDEQMNMGIKGRAKMEKEFDRQIVVDKYCKEIHKN